MYTHNFTFHHHLFGRFWLYHTQYLTYIFYFNTVKYKRPSIKVTIKKYIKYFIKIIFNYDITVERRLKKSKVLLDNQELLRKYIFKNVQQMNSLHFAILTSWSYLFHYYIAYHLEASLPGL